MNDAPFITTYSGQRVNLLNPDPSTIRIEDIAVSLSRICRFNGHTSDHYSVARHSIAVSLWLVNYPVDVQLAGLLHDAHEAYIGGIATPVKVALGTEVVGKLAYRLDCAIAEYVGIDSELFTHPAVKKADEIMLRTEAHSLLSDSAWSLHDAYQDVLIPPVHVSKPKRVGMDYNRRSFEHMYYDFQERLHGHHRTTHTDHGGS